MAIYANRGMVLETLIDHMNIVYRHKGIALIQKIPAAWVPIRGAGGKIVSAKIDRSSGVDYMGVCQQGAIAFEAKSTVNRNRWSLNNITAEQIGFLQDHQVVSEHALQFVLLGFMVLGVYYLIDIDYMLEKWGEWKGGGKASISVKELSDFPSSVIKYPFDYLSLTMKQVF